MKNELNPTQIGYWEAEGNGRGRPVVREDLFERGPDGIGYWIADEDMPSEEILKELRNGSQVLFEPVPPKTGFKYDWDNATNIRPVKQSE